MLEEWHYEKEADGDDEAESDMSYRSRETKISFNQGPCRDAVARLAPPVPTSNCMHPATRTCAKVKLVSIGCDEIDMWRYEHEEAAGHCKRIGGSGDARAETSRAMKTWQRGPKQTGLDRMYRPWKT